MENFDGLLKEMTVGELIELLMVGKKKHEDPFFWFEQVERILTELKGRLKTDETMDIKSILRMIRLDTYR